MLLAMFQRNFFPGAEVSSVTSHDTSIQSNLAGVIF